jgi:hypothetical protein
MARLRSTSGRVLTGNEVERLSMEAERGYDVKALKPERVRPGRPSLDEGVSPRISYRVAGGLYERTKARAEAEGRTVSDVAREALELYVSRRPTKPSRRASRSRSA